MDITTSSSLQERKDFCKPFEKRIASLVSVNDNTMMAVWTMPISWQPLRMAVSIGTSRFTHSLLEVEKTIRLGIPRSDAYETAVLWFGRRSGRDGTKPDPRLVAKDEQMYSFVIEQLIPVGDHTLVICCKEEDYAPRCSG